MRITFDVPDSAVKLVKWAFIPVLVITAGAVYYFTTNDEPAPTTPHLAIETPSTTQIADSTQEAVIDCRVEAVTACQQKAVTACQEAIEYRLTDYDSPFSGAEVLWETAKAEAPTPYAYAVTGTGTARFDGDYGFATAFSFTCQVQPGSFVVLDNGYQLS